jgi:phospholipid transport system substrate-binding protein
MHKFVWKWLFSLCLILGAALAAAQEVAPDILLSQVTSDVIAIVKQARTERTSAPRKIADLVEIRILPHFDFTRMTQSATARHWREATQQQQAALTAEFRTLLVHTYSSAITRYDDQATEFKRLKATPDRH